MELATEPLSKKSIPALRLRKVQRVLTSLLICICCYLQKYVLNFKDPISGPRQYLIIENLLKMINNTFWCYLHLCPHFLVMQDKKKASFIFWYASTWIYNKNSITIQSIYLKMCSILIYIKGLDLISHVIFY